MKKIVLYVMLPFLGFSQTESNEQFNKWVCLMQRPIKVFGQLCLVDIGEFVIESKVSY